MSPLIHRVRTTIFAMMFAGLIMLGACEQLRRSRAAAAPPSLATTSDRLVAQLQAHHLAAEHAPHRIELRDILYDEEADAWLTRRFQAQIIAAGQRAGLDIDLPSRLRGAKGGSYILTCVIRRDPRDDNLRLFVARLDPRETQTDEPEWSASYRMRPPQKPSTAK